MQINYHQKHPSQALQPLNLFCNINIVDFHRLHPDCRYGTVIPWKSVVSKYTQRPFTMQITNATLHNLSSWVQSYSAKIECILNRKDWGGECEKGTHPFLRMQIHLGWTKQKAPGTRAIFRETENRVKYNLYNLFFTLHIYIIMWLQGLRATKCLLLLLCLLVRLKSMLTLW